MAMISFTLTAVYGVLATQYTFGTARCAVWCLNSEDFLDYLGRWLGIGNEDAVPAVQLIHLDFVARLFLDMVDCLLLYLNRNHHVFQTENPRHRHILEAAVGYRLHECTDTVRSKVLGQFFGRRGVDVVEIRKAGNIKVEMRPMLVLRTR